MDDSEQLVLRADPCLLCCRCRRLLKNPVQLSCLHNCCLGCFSVAAMDSNESVACSSCGTITHSGSERPNRFMNSEVQRHVAIAESRSCGVCKENGHFNNPAELWCPSCRHSLCGYCTAGHKQYYRKHVTQSLHELSSLEVVYPPSSAAVCAVHNKPLDIACFDCEQAKCSSCCAECFRKKHKVCAVGDKSVRDYVGKYVALISSTKRELSSRKSGVLEKPKSTLEDLRAARANQLEQIAQRKRRVVDAVECAYQEIECATKNAYDKLEEELHNASSVAERVALSLSDADDYISRLLGSIESENLCEILNQQKIVLERLRVLSAELETVNDALVALQAVKIDPSLPEDLDSIIKTWIGMPHLYSASAKDTGLPDGPQHFAFGTVSAIIRLPFSCYDFTLTKEGRLLLAAGLQGMIEYCSSRRKEVSSWMPPDFAFFHPDSVRAVAALSDGRVAVSTEGGKRVMLVKRNENLDSEAATSVAEWTLVSSIVEMQWCPCYLEAHGDVIAVAQYIGMLLHATTVDKRDLYRSPLQLLSSVDMKPLSAKLIRMYRIICIAITSGSVVTASLDAVKLSDSHEANVLDAHCLVADKRLWRHELRNDELIEGVCADSSASVLYASVRSPHHRNGRVMAINLADGSELRHVVYSFNSRNRHIIRLSVGSSMETVEQQQQKCLRNNEPCRRILTTLCMDYKTRNPKTVITYLSSTDE